MANLSEFSVADVRTYNQRGPRLWLISHAWRNKKFVILGSILFFVNYAAVSYSRILIGRAADEIINPSGGNAITQVSLAVLVVMLIAGLSDLVAALSLEVVANRVERDSREELYISLLGKSQTFHDQQRVGDIMARATDDMRMLTFTVSPGVLFMFNMGLGFLMPMLFIASVNFELLLVPVLFFIGYFFTIRNYIGRLDPVIGEQRWQNGIMNAGLEETITGIEIVKVTAREAFERVKFYNNARKYRDLFVKQGRIEAFYLPFLLYAFAFGFMFLHTYTLYDRGTLTIADVIAVMGLMALIRFPVFMSLFALTLIQMGVASARRIIELMQQESDIDENTEGHQATIEGSITFENVSFAYGDKTIIDNISFDVEPGQTVAIVGQTGVGKTTLTLLVGRTYDTKIGRVLIDGIDVREWNLDSLRSQISKIEQDVFLFSRSIRENIAFGTPNANEADIINAAKEAQAHEFIMNFKDGYETEIGERGVTLSGGQRQRLALARAFLKNPRILIMDDSTSAIDSATEDEIQKAMRRAQQGRTTLLITHRLSQIRWSDRILVLDAGRLIASGTHEDLLMSSPHYRRIFARYDVVLPQSVEE